VELEGLEEGTIRYNYDPYAEGMNLDQIWDKAVDGFGNLLLGTFILFTSDDTEGELIRKALSKHKIDIPEGVSNKQLGENFNLKKRERTVVVEPQEGVLSELLDYTLSTVDAVGIYPGKNGVFMAIKTGPIVNTTISKILRGLKI